MAAGFSSAVVGHVASHRPPREAVDSILLMIISHINLGEIDSSVGEYSYTPLKFRMITNSALYQVSQSSLIVVDEIILYEGILVRL